MKRMSSWRGFLAVLFVFPALSLPALAKPNSELDAGRVLYVTTQDKDNVQKFTVASLNTWLRTEYGLETAAVTEVQASGRALALGVQLISATLLGPSAPLVLGNLSAPP